MSEFLRVSGIVAESVVDGPGYRYAIFAQGCNRRCEGCHNLQTLPMEGGELIKTEDLFTEIKKNPLLKGVTFSGGEPFLQARAFAKLAQLAHGIGKDVITYTGYTYEELLAGANNQNCWQDLLDGTDFLIDGPFILAQKSLQLKFRGSANQRIIDVKKSKKAAALVLADL